MQSMLSSADTRLDEDARAPVAFAAQLENLLMRQQIVIVACATPRDIPLVLENLYPHFAISPGEMVAASGPLPLCRFLNLVGLMLCSVR